MSYQSWVDRDQKIFEARLFDKKTYGEIGKEHGISSTRVQQIIHKMNSRSRNNHKIQKRLMGIIKEKSEAISALRGNPKAEVGEGDFISINRLPLSVRTTNCLHHGLGIENIYELKNFEESYIMRTPNFGTRSLNELKEVCSSLGFSIGEDVSKNINKYDPINSRSYWRL